MTDNRSIVSSYFCGGPKEVSEVAILDRDTQDIVYLWRADGLGWISLV